MNEIKYTFLNNGNLQIEHLLNRNIIFRNFSGHTSQYNKNGDLKFTLVINDPEIAQNIADHGWNVKIKPPRNEGEEPFCTLEVKIRFDLEWAKPKIMQVTRRRKMWIDKDNIANFDNAEFETVDLILRPYAWRDASGKSGISAQLSEMYAQIQESVLKAKWAEEESPDDDEMPFDM